MSSKYKMNITMPLDVREKLDQIAWENRRSMSSMIHCLIIEEYNRRD